MRAVKTKNTSPEITVRRLLRAAGHTGYRLHRVDISGKPDIAFIRKKLAIFVHGCFWHGHDCPAGTNRPKTNVAYWQQKISRNSIRDNTNLQVLSSKGWRTLVVWECETKKTASLTAKLKQFFTQAASL
jgi:DNA mismatch endonuclease (patch repair protein)